MAQTCSSCKTSKSDRAFPFDGRRRGNLALVCHDCLNDARENAELETEDFEGVEILSTGGPIHGKGSPPEGDSYTTDDLRRMAEAHAELGDEIRAPAKIGHGGAQPAVGWLDKVRVSDDGTKLLSDIRRVPKRLASLIRAGAYRTRSVELGRVKSQRTGKSYDLIPTGLAWLGGTRPAVQTLADVTALYEGELEAEPERVYELEQQAEPDALLDAIAGFGVEYAAAVAKEIPPASDTRGRVEPITLSEDAAAKLGTSLGIEGDVTPEKLEAAAEARANELAEAKALADKAPKEGERNYSTEEIADLAKKAEAGERAAQKLYENERAAVIDGAAKDGKVNPADRDRLVRLYDADEEGTREYLENLKPNEAILREFGSDDEGKDTPSEEKTKDEREGVARQFGLSLDEVPA